MKKNKKKGIETEMCFYQVYKHSEYLQRSEFSAFSGCQVIYCNSKCRTILEIVNIPSLSTLLFVFVILPPPLSLSALPPSATSIITSCFLSANFAFGHLPLRSWFKIIQNGTSSIAFLSMFFFLFLFG